MPVVKFDISPPLRNMKPLLAKGCTLRENEEEGPIPLGPVGPVVPDPVVQRVLGKIGIPAPIISFDGNSNLCGCSPPDPNGAVGPNNVVTMANLHFQIFDKSGNSLFGPAANNTLWSGFGGHLPDGECGRSGRSLRSIGRSLDSYPVYLQRARVLRVCRRFAD